MAAPVSKPVAVAAVSPSVHVVNHGDTLLSIARHNHVSVPELAQRQQSRSCRQAQHRHEAGSARREDSCRGPGGCARGRCRRSTDGGRCAARDQIASADNQQKARLAQAAPNAEEPAVESPVKAAEATGALPTFRWPVRGKVITAYGAKANGKSNDGINLAVPEGTPIKAADDGVVAYSGNELKSYGNLVLVKHPNGYVTAYAHASELLVKRGDTIKRGQVIAKSGQSGEVQSPQLHFEIRKGQSPVDPLQFLNGA